MNRKVLSLNLWVKVFSFLALFGMGFFLVGLIKGDETLMSVGKWLVTPIILGGILLVVIGFPLLVSANRKLKPKD